MKTDSSSPPNNLTPKQKKVLDFIQDFLRERGYGPSQQEIARHFGFSSLGTVQNYLVRLEQNGYLSRSWNAKRGLTPTFNENSLPLLGHVAAGKPIESLLNDERIEVPPFMLEKLRKDPDNLFVLKVVGDSMLQDGILEGDYVIIRKQKTAESGQKVVALIEHGATIKRFFKLRDRIELHSANPQYAPIVVRPHDPFEIEGLFVGLIRVEQ
ncbi:MAG: transcriptional repressor LexA [Bdellovibrionales bacterium]